MVPARNAQAISVDLNSIMCLSSLLSIRQKRAYSPRKTDRARNSIDALGLGSSLFRRFAATNIEIKEAIDTRARGQ